jgi:hypothetical protein
LAETALPEPPRVQAWASFLQALEQPSLEAPVCFV